MLSSIESITILYIITNIDTTLSIRTVLMVMISQLLPKNIFLNQLIIYFLPFLFIPSDLDIIEIKHLFSISTATLAFLKWILSITGIIDILLLMIITDTL